MNVNKMSYQAIFNKISKHLIKQNSKAIQGDCCVCYDEITGNRCAIGCLLPLNFYKKSDVFIGTYTVMSNINGVDDPYKYTFIKSFQHIHDNESVNNWTKKLIELARKYSLKTPDFLKVK